MAGFEGSTGLNIHGQWFDQISATRHDQHVDADYHRLRCANIRAARESIRWPLVDTGLRYDFNSVLPFLKAAGKNGILLIHDLFHFGYPRSVDLFAPNFPDRFAEYCYSAARYVISHSEGPYFFTPVNEPSYFAWAAGEAALFAPFLRKQSWELKICLVRAAIAGINAIRGVCPEARIVNVDPVCRVVAPPGRPDLQQEADNFNNVVVFQAWDMLAGRLMPELGGSLSHLDIVGINYYWTNQWEIDAPGRPLAEEDGRKWPLRKIVRLIAERYGTEILLSETSHVGDERPAWIRMLAGEAEALLTHGIPLRGICIYPILSMPEWHDRRQWTHMGLWDLVPKSLTRVCYEPMFQALRKAQQRIALLSESRIPLRTV